MNDASGLAGFPVYQGRGALGDYLRFSRDPIRFLSKAVDETGDLFRISFGADQLFVVNDPESIREVLIDKKDAFEVGWGSADVLATYLGRGILTTRGAEWRESRADTQAQLNQEQLDSYLPVIHAQVEELLADWSAKAARDEKIDVCTELMKLSFKVLCRSLLGYSPTEEDSSTFVHTIAVIQADVFTNRSEGLHRFRNLPTPRNLRIRSATRSLYSLADRIISGSTTSPNVGSRCPFQRWTRGDDPTRTKQKAKILSLLLAGPESVSNSLSWAFLMMGAHPDAQTRGPDESFSDGISNVIHETLRLYPAGWAFERRCIESSEIQGRPVPVGATVLISPMILHRNAKYWPEPERFEPLRFSGGKPKLAPRYAYIPFGAGHRSCIGSRFAMMQMQATLEAVLKRFRFTLASPPEVEPKGYFKLRPGSDILIRLVNA